jgi:transposase
MPRVIQPGGGRGKMRVRYTARRKRGLVATSKRMIAEGMTLRAAAEELCVSAANLSKWASQGMGEIDRLDKILRSKKRAGHTGPSSQLKAIEDGLLRYIFEKREQGIEVSTFTVVLRASFLSPEFREKSFTARCSCVKRFLHAHSFSYRMGTHTSQRPPAEVEGEASDFMRFVRVIVSGANRDRRFILNMDQTPVYFSMSSKKTLELIGKKTIHIRTSTNDTKRVTVAVTITADGTVLPSTLVFKGMPGGRIEKSEFSTYPNGHFYKCQENAWMDEEVMIAWVKDVLAPYVATAPDHVVPILILDKYRCHMMSSVVQMIQELGVEVQHIPGGCTSLCQPVDVSFNTPFKDRMRRQWINWMTNEGVVHGTTSPPARLDVTKWVQNAMLEMKGRGDIIRNAWKRHDYEWFVATATAMATATATVNDDGAEGAL